jgi:hypothetical protein
MGQALHVASPIHWACLGAAWTVPPTMAKIKAKMQARFMRGPPNSLCVSSRIGSSGQSFTTQLGAAAVVPPPGDRCFAMVTEMGRVGAVAAPHANRWRHKGLRGKYPAHGAAWRLEILQRESFTLRRSNPWSRACTIPA